MQFYGISFMHPYKQSATCQDMSGYVRICCIKHILTSTSLLKRMHKKITLKLDVQVFLKMNTWMFETCRRHYN